MSERQQPHGSTTRASGKENERQKICKTTENVSVVSFENRVPSCVKLKRI